MEHPAGGRGRLGAWTLWKAQGSCLEWRGRTAGFRCSLGRGADFQDVHHETCPGWQRQALEAGEERPSTSFPQSVDSPESKLGPSEGRVHDYSPLSPQRLVLSLVFHRPSGLSNKCRNRQRAGRKKDGSTVGLDQELRTPDKHQPTPFQGQVTGAHPSLHCWFSWVSPVTRKVTPLVSSDSTGLEKLSQGSTKSQSG